MRTAAGLLGALLLFAMAGEARIGRADSDATLEALGFFASVEAAVQQPGACLVKTELRATTENRVLVSLPITLRSGEKGALLTLAGGRRVRIQIDPAPGCTGGVYSVSVAYGKANRIERGGDLTPVSPSRLAKALQPAFDGAELSAARGR